MPLDGPAQYHRGRVNPQIWVVGGVERRTAGGDIGPMFIVPVVLRTKVVLTGIITTYIRPGSTIMTDMWPAYKGVANLPQGYRHQTVNHSEHFVDPETGAHTQSIESTWRHLRESLPSYGLRPAYLDQHLNEYLYRRLHKHEDEVMHDLISFSLAQHQHQQTEDAPQDDDDGDDDGSDDDEEEEESGN